MTGTRVSAVGVIAYLALLGLATAQPELPDTLIAAGDQATANDFEKQVVAGERLLQRMRDAASTLERQIAEAQHNRDMLRRSCLEAKAALVAGGIHVGQQALVELKAAVAARDVIGVNHASAKLTVADQRVTTWSQQAGDCVGQGLIQAGTTEVSVTIAGDIPQDDPTEALPPPPSPGGVTMRPPIASPIR